MRKTRSLWFAIWVLFSVGVAVPSGAQEVRVMTRNQYIGTDIAPFLSASTPQEFIARLDAGLARIAGTNFPERAVALAREIADKKPHLVGLQEVYRLALNGQTGAPPFRDHLEDLLAALAATGSDYYVAGQVINMHLLLPSPMGVVEATDRVVVLARADVLASPVAVPGCRTSADGCNYNVVAVFNSPLGITIAIERGFVIVDAVVEGRSIRFANTHLEVPELPLILQSAQAAQLVATLQALPNVANVPVIVTGDMNSAPTDETVVLGEMTIVPPYRQFAEGGYADTWLLRPGTPPGFTCCESEGLLNTESLMFKRVDLIWTNRAAAVHANLVGVDLVDRTPSGLWPSDHAGVFARLWYER